MPKDSLEVGTVRHASRVEKYIEAGSIKALV
jgi:hypothetical protein